MELTSDVILKGSAWTQAWDELSTIFSTRPNYSIFMLSLAIGIMYDQRIEALAQNSEDDEKTVTRTIIYKYDNGKLDVMFQTVILTTVTETLSEDERLELAFGEKGEFNRIKFLIQFANFGVTKLLEKVGASQLETMYNINNFLVNTVEGRNLEINSLTDDLLLSDE